ncbi:MAG: MFS transporter [Desulfobacterales bacterium]
MVLFRVAFLHFARMVRLTFDYWRIGILCEVVYSLLSETLPELPASTTQSGANMNSPDRDANYKWVVLTLAALTHTLSVAIPMMCLPVLFKEISDDLGLSLVQIGTIWGSGFVPIIIMGIVGGVLGDRFGTRRILRMFCILAGIACGLRAFSSGFITLLATNLLYGFLFPAIPMNVHKTCAVWFSKRQLGLANGVVSMGMAAGFMVGSMISATVMSPWLGGWRNVLVFYGAVSVVVGVLWHFTDAPSGDEASGPAVDRVSFRDAIAHVLPIRNVWLLGVALFGFGGCAQGLLGYLPLYLRGIGWAGALADGALGAFHGVSAVAVIPIALLSDRLGLRKKILISAALMMTVGTGLVSIADGLVIWVAVILAGMIRDGFMSVLMTTIIETEGIGAAYAGTGIGFVMIFSGLSNLISPPLGNSLAQYHPRLPFVFWAGLGVVGLIALLFVREGDRA